MLVSKWKADNGNAEVRKELKKLVIKGMQSNKIPFQSGLITLAKLE